MTSQPVPPAASPPAAQPIARRTRDHRRHPRGARDRVLHLLRPLHRRALVRPARLPRRAHHAVGRDGRSMFVIGFLGMASPGLAEHRDRVPRAAGLREAQLAARPLPAGHRAAASPRDVRHPDRARHLRRRLDGRRAGPPCCSTCNRTPFGQGRPAVRPRRLVLRLRAAVLPRRGRLRLGGRARSPVSRRSPPATSTAASASAVARCASRAPRASSSPSPPPSTSPCRPSASGSTSTRRSPTTSAGSSPAPRYTEVNATIPGRAILAGIAALVAVLFIVTAVIGRWRLPIIGTALLIVSSLVVGVDLPGDHRSASRSSRARRPSRRRTSSATSTRPATRVRRRRRQGRCRTTRRRTPSAAPCAQDAETTANIRIIDPALVTETFAQLERVQAVLPVRAAPRRRPLRDRRQDPGHRDRGARAQPGRPELRQLVQQHARLHARLRRRRRLRQPAHGRRPAGVPRVGHPAPRARSATSEPRIYFGENSPDVLDRRARRRARSRSSSTTRRGDERRAATNATTDLHRRRRAEARQLLQASSSTRSSSSRSRSCSPTRVTDDSQILYDRNPIDRACRRSRRT